jgi:hypothetical protein
VYVLTSDRTFSAAEEFTYNLKNLKRAIIVGDTTGGGAHPVDMRLFTNLNVGMSLPFGRAVNPITGTNWEGTGVTPDIAVEREKALEVAHMTALRTIHEKEQDPDILADLEWTIDNLVAMQNPPRLAVEDLKQYVGKYGPRVITMENEQLLYQREQNPKYRLIPMSTDLFAVEGLDFFRVGFERDKSGEVTKIVGNYQGGHQDENNRSE